MDHGGFVYILTNKRNGTLYIGVTSNLEYRTAQHKTHFYPNSFTARYELNMLVYFEHFDRIETAIAREKQLKDWNRNWKKDLIEKSNPDWDDLWEKFHLDVAPKPTNYDPNKVNVKQVEEKHEYDPNARIFRKIFKGQK